MTIYQQYLGQFSLTSAMNDFTVDDGGGADAVSLTAADYYMVGYTGEATAQLCEHMQAQIRAVGSPYTTATVTFSASTQKVTITFNSGGTVTIAWTDSALQTLLGFTGTQSGADTYTGTNKARYCWAPSLSPSDYPGDLASVWLGSSTSTLSVAPDGKLVATEGNVLYSAPIVYECLDRAEVISDSATVWETFERFWLDVIHKGMPVRAYPDKTLSASTSYVTGRMIPSDADPLAEGAIAIGDIHKFCARMQPGFNGLWRVAFRLAKDV